MDESKNNENLKVKVSDKFKIVLAPWKRYRFKMKPIDLSAPGSYHLERALNALVESFNAIKLEIDENIYNSLSETTKALCWEEVK